jgi:hypothetical protein
MSMAYKFGFLWVSQKTFIYSFSYLNFLVRLSSNIDIVFHLIQSIVKAFHWVFFFYLIYCTFDFQNFNLMFFRISISLLSFIFIYCTIFLISLNLIVCILFYFI